MSAGSEVNPWAPENIEQFQLIATLRLYDAIMALLTSQDEDMAAALNEAHEGGRLIGSFPWLNGEQ